MLHHQRLASWHIGTLVRLNAGWLFLFAVICTVVLLLMGSAFRWAGGLVAGCGLPCLWFAYLNIHGPGTVCTGGRRLMECVQESDGRIWGVVGLSLLGIGFMLGFVAAARRESRTQE